MVCKTTIEISREDIHISDATHTSESLDYEVGLIYSQRKSANGRDCILSEIENYQFEKTFPVSLTNPMGTDYGIINAEEVRGKGVEAEIVTQVNENLLLSAALGINDMTFEKHADTRVIRCLSLQATLKSCCPVQPQGGFYGRIEYRR